MEFVKQLLLQDGIKDLGVSKQSETALLRIPAAFRKKLDSKSKECIFVGYSDNTKGYIYKDVVDPVTKKCR